MGTIRLYEDAHGMQIGFKKKLFSNYH